MRAESASAASALGNQLDLLRRLAEMLENCENLAATLDAALALMAESLGMIRGAITLVDPKTGQIRIEASWGLNSAQRKRGAYAPGEGITGRVIATGEAMCVADVAGEPLFLNRTRSRDLACERISFLCVPIKLGGAIVGALSVDRPACPGHELAEDMSFLRIIAALLAHAAYESQEHMDTPTPALPYGFVGRSQAIRQLCEQIDIVAPAATTVFLQGESGTGKELAARAIHAASPRARGPFISLNCAALPENLIESELFGHERGAFTGASQMRKGRFEMAHGGTLFLDEIGELSAPVQAKLLRVLQERAFERVGGMETLRPDARVIAATNRDLAKMVELGAFRRDLFYRLNVFPIYLPPLRERMDDLLPLATHFLEKFSAGAKPPRLSLAAMDMLHAYAWPGNIRELQNIMERALLLAGHDSLILPRHLPASLRGNANGAKNGDEASRHFFDTESHNLQSCLDEVEKATVMAALRFCHGNVRRAAGILGLTERKLGLRLKKYALDYRAFRNGN